jgi:hypothetical protein
MDDTNRAWAVCWEPANDFSDHQMSELVLAVAADGACALDCALKLARSRAREEGDGWQVSGLDGALAQVAAGQAQVRISISNPCSPGAYGGGSFVLMRLPLHRPLPRGT